jgi:hypothetical protein
MRPAVMSENERSIPLDSATLAASGSLLPLAHLPTRGLRPPIDKGLRPPIDNVLSGRGAVDGEVVEELLHGDAELFVVAVDGGPV